MIRVPYFQTDANVWKDEVCEVPALEVASSQSKKSKAQLGQLDLELEPTYREFQWYLKSLFWKLPESKWYMRNPPCISILSHHSNLQDQYRRSELTPKCPQQRPTFCFTVQVRP